MMSGARLFISAQTLSLSDIGCVINKTAANNYTLKLFKRKSLNTNYNKTQQTFQPFYFQEKLNTKL